METSAKNTKKGQVLSLDGIIMSIIIAGVLLGLGAYILQTLANSLTTGSTANVNNTFNNVTSAFAQAAPLLAVVAIIGMIAIVLFLVRVGMAGSQRQF